MPKQRIQWRTANDTDQENEHYNQLTATINDDPSMTMQSFTEDADINVIVKRYGIKDGGLPPAMIDWPELDLSEFSDQMDLSSVMERTRAVETAFMQLDAKVRTKFDNQPFRLWNALSDPNRYDELTEMGFLLKQTPSATPAPPPPPEASNPSTG